MLVFSIVILVLAVLAPVLLYLVGGPKSKLLWMQISIYNFFIIFVLGVESSIITSFLLTFAYFIWFGQAEGIAKKKFPLWYKKSYHWRFDDPENPVVAEKKAKEAEDAEAEKARLAGVLERAKKKEKRKTRSSNIEDVRIRSCCNRRS